MEMQFYEINHLATPDTFGAVYTQGMALSEADIPEEMWPIYFVAAPTAGILRPTTGMTLLTEPAKNVICHQFPSLSVTPVQDIHCLNWTWDEWVGSYGLTPPEGVDPRDFIEGSGWLEELLKDGAGRTREIKLWRLELRIGAFVRTIKKPVWSYERELEMSTWNGDVIFLNQFRTQIIATEAFKEVASPFDGGELIWRTIDRII